MKTLVRVLSLLSVLIPCLTGLGADTILLKSGETISGKILEENPDAIVVDYKVSASISDQKAIPRADIAKIEKEPLDEIAFKGIQGYKVDPEWSMQPEQYNRTIQALNDFLSKYPKSTHAEAVKQNMAALSAEKERIAKGELKLFGNWLTKEQAEKQHSQIQAQAAFSNMRDMAMQGDLVGALNVFEMIKTSYKSALIFPGAIQYAGALIPNLQRQIGFQKQEILKEEEDWKHTIAMASEPRKTQLINSHAQIAQRAEAALASAPKGGTKLAPAIPHSLKSLDSLESSLTSVKTEILAFPVAKMKQSIKLSNEAADSIAAKDYVAADASLKEAQTLWPENSALDYFKGEITRLKAIPTPTPAAVIAAKAAADSAAKAKAHALAAAPTPAPVEEPPFYMTSKGAAMIVVGLLVLLGLGSLVAKILNKPKESAETQSFR